MSTPPAHRPTTAAELYSQFADKLLTRLKCEFYYADEDVLADAVVDAVMRRARSSQPEDESVLYRTARDSVRSAVRSDNRRRKWEKMFDPGVTEFRSAALPVVEAVSRREQFDLYRGRIARTDTEQDVLDLWLNGYSEVREVARLTDLSEANAKATLNRFRQRCFRERPRCEDE